MANLKFRRVSSLPAKGAAGCEVGNIYFLSGENAGIYVCTSTDGETASYVHYSTEALATTAAAGLMSANDKTKLDGVAEGATKVEASTTNGKIKINGTETTVFTEVAGTVHDANYKHISVSATDGVTAGSGDEAVTYKYTLPTATTEVLGGIKSQAAATEEGVIVDASTGKASVYIEGLKTRVGAIETTIASGLRYKGEAATLPTSGEVGDVYRCTAEITLGEKKAEIGDFLVCNTKHTTQSTSAWDIWQGNVDKAAFWGSNTITDGSLAVVDGTTGKLKSGSTNDVVLTSYAKGSVSALDTAIASTDTVNAGISKLEVAVSDLNTEKEAISNKITGWGTEGASATNTTYPSAKLVYDTITDNEATAAAALNALKTRVDGHDTSISSLGTSKVTGLSSVTENNIVTWGTDGITVKDSGKSISLLNEATTSSAGVMSANDKTKLDGIATGAEVNQNAFSNVTVGSTTVAANAKTDTVSLVAGAGITLTADASAKSVTFACEWAEF